MFKVPNKNRVRTGKLATSDLDGNNGAFTFNQKKNKPDLFVVASDGMSWEHVSVSTIKRIPTWQEMCFIKDKFWGKEDCVVQYHPPESEYVNNHPYCLHMWRHSEAEIRRPPMFMVGDKNWNGISREELAKKSK